MFLAFFAGIALLVAGAPRALAAPMVVSDVSVDVTAKNAAAARDQAIADAQRKAFDRLVKRLVPNPVDQVKLKPSQPEIESFVQDFEVQSERVSSVRYIGLYSVRFRAERVRKYLSDSGVSAVSDLQHVVIVPIYRTPAGYILWEQGNRWRAAWERGGFGDGPVTLILPNGDPFDTASLSSAAAGSGDVAAIASIIQRYNAAALVVAEAEPRDPGRGAASGLTITATTYDSAGQKGSQTVTLEPQPNEQPDKVFLRGVAATAGALENSWRDSSGAVVSLAGPPLLSDTPSIPTGPVTAYPIAIPFSGMADWVKAHNLLTALPGVQLLALDALTRDGAAVTLAFAGDTPALQAALASGGYALTQIAPANASGPGTFELRWSGAVAVRPLTQ